MGYARAILLWLGLKYLGGNFSLGISWEVSDWGSTMINWEVQKNWGSSFWLIGSDRDLNTLKWGPFLIAWLTCNWLGFIGDRTMANRVYKPVKTEGLHLVGINGPHVVTSPERWFMSGKSSPNDRIDNYFSGQWIAIWFSHIIFSFTNKPNIRT